MPFENSTNGQVVFTYDLLRDWSSKSDCKFQIVGEQFVSINHFFLTNATLVSQVKTLYSHPQVWGQVAEFSKSVLSELNINKIDVSSTSKAAEMVANDPTNTSAAISSEMAAGIYNLPKLYENIEDISNNTTRFLILGYQKPPAYKDEKDDDYITSILFTLNHNDPGALCSALDVFRKHKVNLSSINSRPSHLKQWQYVFFAEFHGNLERDEDVKQSLKELSNECQLTILGSFKRNWRYYGKSK